MKRNKSLLKISVIERECGFNKDTLQKSLNRNSKTFKQADKLVPIYLQLIGH